MLATPQPASATPSASSSAGKRWACLAVVLLFVVAYAQRESHILSSDGQQRDVSYYDFAVYYTAAKIAHQSGVMLYYPDFGSVYSNPTGRHADPNTPWGQTAKSAGFSPVQNYIYPPFFALLVSPMAYLSPQMAYFIWRELNTLMLLAAVVFGLCCVGAELSLPVAFLASVGAVSFFPFIETASLGQLGTFILLLWTLGIYFLLKTRPALSALCFALGTMVKLTPVIVLPLFLLRRQWKWLLAYVGWCVLFLMASIWGLGWQNHVIYFARVLPTMGCGYPLATNVSVATLLQSIVSGGVLLQPADAIRADLTMPAWVCASFKGLCLLGYVALLVFFWKTRERGTRRLAIELIALAIASVLLSPIVWRHSYVILVLPLLLLWTNNEFLRPSRTYYSLLLLATLVTGTLLPQFALAHIRIAALQICLQAVMPAAALLLLWFTLRASRSRAPSY
ncbi:MAG TPA: glycosyltransferase family 87 protein [Terriglobales bacterium]|nr:glycosyltransferase family 87 protein [Terriglobales bacterium]